LLDDDVTVAKPADAEQLTPALGRLVRRFAV
jgi:hypothetical protein